MSLKWSFSRRAEPRIKDKYCFFRYRKKNENKQYSTIFASIYRLVWWTTKLKTFKVAFGLYELYIVIAKNMSFFKRLKHIHYTIWTVKSVILLQMKVFKVNLQVAVLLYYPNTMWPSAQPVFRSGILSEISLRNPPW